ncbi:maltose fermentation regulatory protein [Acrasis kona]|uniref:Maltose fermentation regulatory protein n=1 Tax=Acrasis kona TaxID=1008807 RepID=A0AAW2Z219_9EUKA
MSSSPVCGGSVSTDGSNKSPTTIQDEASRQSTDSPVLHKHSAKGSKKITVACEYCRTHHRKCNGANPCSNCTEKNMECIFIAGRKRGPKNDALKKMKSEMDALRDDIESIKQSEQNWKRRYCEVASSSPDVCTADINLQMFIHNNNNNPNEEERVLKRKKFAPSKGELQSTLGNEQSFVLSSMINDFVSIYETYIHPSHPLLPSSNYTSLLPEIISLVIKNEKSDVCSSFYIYSLLSNGALSTGNKKLAIEFFERARVHAGDVFDVVDTRVGCGFSMLAYYQLCTGDVTKSVTYANIAKSIAENMNLHQSHLHMNSILGVAFVSNNYEERMKLFQIMSNSKYTADLVFCLAGQVITEVKFKESPNWTLLIDMLLRALKIQSEAELKLFHKPGDKILLEVLVFAALIMTLRKANFKYLAYDYCKKLLNLAADTQFNYLCVGVTCCALEAAAEVLIEQRQEAELNQILMILEKLSVKYELCVAVLQGVKDRIREYQYQQRQLMVNLNVRVHERAGNYSDLNSIIHEQYAPQPMHGGVNVSEHFLYN